MEFDKPTVKGIIHKRYKRFLADVELLSDFNKHKKGEVITVHTANTGSMKTCWEPGWEVLLSYHDNPKRKLKFSLEMTNNGHTWIGINTSLPNSISKDAILEGMIDELSQYKNVRSEVKVGNSRIDLLCYNGESHKDAKDKCFVEVKNVTLLGDNSRALFPDAVSERGQKHLRELMDIKSQGIESAMLYIIQREDVDSFSPAEHIDPTYAQLLKQAKKEGVKILAYRCRVSPDGVYINKKLPIKL